MCPCNRDSRHAHDTLNELQALGQNSEHYGTVTAAAAISLTVAAQVRFDLPVEIWHG